MPMYEYKCTSCGRVSEQYEAGAKASGSAPAKCPKCGKGRMERVFSLFASSCGGGETGSVSGSGGGCGSHGGFS